jgi:hypothetical protein
LDCGTPRTVAASIVVHPACTTRPRPPKPTTCSSSLETAPCSER